MANTFDTSFDIVELLFRTRHSCRAFLQKSAERSDIERILKTAQRTASWCNTQPWHVSVASGATVRRYREKLRALLDQSRGQPDLAFPACEGVYQHRRKESSLALYKTLGISKGDHEGSATDAAEFRACRCTARRHHLISEIACAYGAVDCGAYVASFLLVAHSLG